jgi:hypothetical protein
MPFTLIYPVGTGKTELFESGEQMRDISRNGKPALRRNIPEGDTFALYRVDSLVDRDKSQEQQYYTQFAIRDEFIQFYAAEYGEKLEKNRDKDKLDKLMSQYLFWVEFDIERNMQCFMYTNQDGNDDERFINQTATPMTKQLEEAKKCLVESDGNKEWTFKPNIKLYCPVGVGGKFEEIILRQVSPIEVSGEVIFRQMIEGTGGDTYFHITQDQDSKAIWKVNLQEYKIKNKRTFLEPKLRIRLSLQQGELDLTYSVYDPDLTGENVHEIKMSHDSRKAPPPFNPYRGEE